MIYSNKDVLAVLLLSVACTFMRASAAPVRRESEAQDPETALANLKAGLIASFKLAVSLIYVKLYDASFDFIWFISIHVLQHSGEMELLNFTSYEPICHVVDLTNKLLPLDNESGSGVTPDSHIMDSLMAFAGKIKEDACAWVNWIYYVVALFIMNNTPPIRIPDPPGLRVSVHDFCDIVTLPLTHKAIKLLLTPPGQCNSWKFPHR